ncbi:MAG: hypothetical protein BRC44_17300 [Cyanobacteria bacterium QS_4_48_99]|nr:MAG: hypothetical protein BRC42_12775 [Cyanobacteria bacterium QS_1_48_34]PSO76026.1 MAG: hypothetical protein BRC44_17300 [Cyanobacteria bacterium QS_4_48_99]
MVSSEEFKEALRGGKLEQALLLAMSPAMELKITTQLASDSEQITPSSRLQTRINLIEGKLENEIGEQFLNNAPYRELQQFHLEQVKEGNQTIQQNIGSLQTLFAIVMDIQQHTREGFQQQPALSGMENLPLPAKAPHSEPQTSAEETPPSQPQEEEDLDDTDEWDDSVLDVLQSFPAEAPLQTPTSEAEEPPPSDEMADGELETEEEEQADEILSLEDLEVDAETSSPTEQSQERGTEQDWLEPENTRSSQPKEEDTTTSQTQREWEDWSDTDSAEAQEKEWNMEAPKSESVSTDWDDDDEEFSEATEQNRRESGGWSKRLGISWLNPLRSTDSPQESENETSPSEQEDELFTDWPEDTEAENPQESSDSNAYKDNQNSGG